LIDWKPSLSKAKPPLLNNKPLMTTILQRKSRSVHAAGLWQNLH
jgi:hypothetical protein